MRMYLHHLFLFYQSRLFKYAVFSSPTRGHQLPELCWWWCWCWSIPYYPDDVFVPRNYYFPWKRSYVFLFGVLWDLELLSAAGPLQLDLMNCELVGEMSVSLFVDKVVADVHWPIKFLVVEVEDELRPVEFLVVEEEFSTFRPAGVGGGSQ